MNFKTSICDSLHPPASLLRIAYENRHVTHPLRDQPKQFLFTLTNITKISLGFVKIFQDESIYFLNRDSLFVLLCCFAVKNESGLLLALPVLNDSAPTVKALCYMVHCLTYLAL